MINWCKQAFFPSSCQLMWTSLWTVLFCLIFSLGPPVIRWVAHFHQSLTVPTAVLQDIKHSICSVYVPCLKIRTRNRWAADCEFSPCRRSFTYIKRSRPRYWSSFMEKIKVNKKYWARAERAGIKSTSWDLESFCFFRFDCSSSSWK